MSMTYSSSESVTGKEKRADAAAYGYTGSLGDAEYDHLVSLELGGDPNDPANLWVEPPSPGHKPGSGVNNPKDKVEAMLHTAVCSGKVTLAAAQQAIASNWATADQKLGRPAAAPRAATETCPGATPTRCPGTTTRIEICSGTHQGEIFLLDVDDGQAPPAEQWIDGLRHALEWGSPVDGLDGGWHYCPREEPARVYVRPAGR